MNPTDLITQEPFKSLFPIKDQTLGAIAATMMQSGYDPAHPIIIWKGKNVVVDGHTRLDAAIAAGIEDVPVVEHNFPSEDVAVRYAIDCQRNRRNLTDADIMRLVQELDKRRRQGERTDLASSDAKSGKSATDTAEAIGISTRKVEQVRTVNAKATPEVKQAVADGKMSINAAVKTVASKAHSPSPSVATDEPTETEEDVSNNRCTPTKAEISERKKAFNKANDAREALQGIYPNNPHREEAFADVARHAIGWCDAIAPKMLRTAWSHAKKSERAEFLSWVDKERLKDLPKGDYVKATRVAMSLRRILKHLTPGQVDTVLNCELDAKRIDKQEVC